MVAEGQGVASSIWGGIIGPAHHLISDPKCKTLNDFEMNRYFTLNFWFALSV